ncbi:MAG: limonene-1,2-epoxide hydrolase family protein [Ilumatobacteraceae bacterium]
MTDAGQRRGGSAGEWLVGEVRRRRGPDRAGRAGRCARRRTGGSVAWDGFRRVRKQMLWWVISAARPETVAARMRRSSSVPLGAKRPGGDPHHVGVYGVAVTPIDTVNAFIQSNARTSLRRWHCSPTRSPTRTCRSTRSSARPPSRPPCECSSGPRARSTGWSLASSPRARRSSAGASTGSASGSGWLELPVAGVFEVNDEGLITLWRDYFDMGAYQRQMAELTAS